MKTRMMTACVAFLAACLVAFGAAAEHFKVGFAQGDITPQQPTPMWGYSDRGDNLSTGTRDPLYAKAIVIDTAEGKAALVGLDIGRAPTAPMMEQIKATVLEQAGIEFVMIVGSHSHHSPVIELRDAEGMGAGNPKLEGAIAYSESLPGLIVDVILEAAAAVQDAQIGWGSKQVDMNRNRHSQLEVKPIDQELSVIRFDDLDGGTIALMVAYGAHPTNLPVHDMVFSAEWPGEMMNSVEERLGVPTAFFQGACGDLSTKRTPEMEEGIAGYGKALADHVIEIAEGIETQVPGAPSVHGYYDEFIGTTRVDFENTVAREIYNDTYFPEIVNAYLAELDGNQATSLVTTIVLNGEVALVGVSGEVFAAHSTRLKERSRAAKTLVFSFANDHKMYYPTIEGAAEGGYGGSPQVAWVELGTGERMMDRALIRIFGVLGAWEPGMIPQPAGVLGSPESEAGR